VAGHPGIITSPGFKLSHYRKAQFETGRGSDLRGLTPLDNANLGPFRSVVHSYVTTIRIVQRPLRTRKSSPSDR
jgi:hypothetical protein